jgi:FtsH-binding integral membrane protein
METLRLVLLFLHVLGYAALIGGLLAQARTPEKSVNAAMRDGVGTAFVTGLLLVGVLEAGDGDVDHAKIAVKFAVGLVLLVLVMANTRKERIPQGLWLGLLVLAVANVAVAVFWSPVHVS